MKVKIPKELLAFSMLVMGQIFVSAIFEQSPRAVGAVCLILIVYGVYFHFTVIQQDDDADYDVIGQWADTDVIMVGARLIDLFDRLAGQS